MCQYGTGDLRLFFTSRLAELDHGGRSRVTSGLPSAWRCVNRAPGVDMIRDTVGCPASRDGAGRRARTLLGGRPGAAVAGFAQPPAAR